MFKIVEWGPGYRQEFNPGIFVGELAVTVEDPTKVLFHAGTQRLVLNWIPWHGQNSKGPTKMLVGGLHGTAPGCFWGQDDRLAAWLTQHQGAEIAAQFDSLPIKKDCRPPRKKMENWLMENVTRIFFDVEEQIEPPQLAPTLHFEFPDGTDV